MWEINRGDKKRDSELTHLTKDNIAGKGENKQKNRRDKDITHHPLPGKHTGGDGVGISDTQ